MLEKTPVRAWISDRIGASITQEDIDVLLTLAAGMYWSEDFDNRGRGLAKEIERELTDTLSMSKGALNG